MAPVDDERGIPEREEDHGEVCQWEGRENGRDFPVVVVVPAMSRSGDGEAGCDCDQGEAVVSDERPGALEESEFYEGDAKEHPTAGDPEDEEGDPDELEDSGVERTVGHLFQPGAREGCVGFLFEVVVGLGGGVDVDGGLEVEVG